MAAQQGDQAAPQQQRHPVFSIWGVTHYRDDLGLTISSLQPTHPLAAVGVAALVISIAILVLVLVGWLNLTPGVLTSVVVTVLGLPVAIFMLLALSLVLEMQIKTVLPILCVLAVVYVVRGGSPGYDDPATENSAVQQSVQQQSLNVHSEYETIAQSVCTSMAIKENRAGWTFAVQRRCDSSTETCEAICSATALHVQDEQTKSRKWSCLGAIHVYGKRPVSGPSTVSNPSMGFKVFWNSNYHKGRNCGPNYCCCHAAA